MKHNKESHSEYCCPTCHLDSLLESFIEVREQYFEFINHNIIEQELFPVMDDIDMAIALLSRAQRKVVQARGNYMFSTPDGYDYLTPEELSDIDDSIQLN